MEIDFTRFLGLAQMEDLGAIVAIPQFLVDGEAFGNMVDTAFGAQLRTQHVALEYMLMFQFAFDALHEFFRAFFSPAPAAILDVGGDGGNGCLVAALDDSLRADR